MAWVCQTAQAWLAAPGRVVVGFPQAQKNPAGRYARWVRLILLGLVGLGVLWGAASSFAADVPGFPQTPRRSLADLLEAADEPSPPTARASLPPQPDVQKALQLLEEVYKEDMAAAKTAEKKRALAGRLLADAQEAQNPAEQVALLQAARQWAVQAADVGFALRCVDALAERFQVDPLAIKTETLEALSKSGIGASPLDVAEAAEPLVEEALEQDKYDLAVRLSRLALAAARKTKNAELQKRLTAQNKQVEQAAKVYQKIQAALDTLRQNPKDPEANLLVGRYWCFEKGRWDQGLPHLAQGSDESLRQLASDDLAKPTETAKQVALAEAWYQRAQQEKESSAKSAMQGRAAYWYEQALPNLTGLDKIKAQRRIEEATAAGQNTSPPPPTPRHYLDPQNRKNIAVLWWSGGWRGDGSKFLQIEKHPDGGYRLVASPEAEWVVLIFPKIPLTGGRLKLSYTLEKGRCDLNVRSLQVESFPPYITFPEGNHTLEAWLEDKQMCALLDGQPVRWRRDDPRHYLHYNLSLERGTVVTIHQLEFVPEK
ncbi:MAG: hypothetical protein RMI90_01770 [Thermoguttaceae bacterium]|nr:hypothetical protein [Thermoguttaceae bacterium]